MSLFVITKQHQRSAGIGAHFKYWCRFLHVVENLILYPTFRNDKFIQSYILTFLYNRIQVKHNGGYLTKQSWLSQICSLALAPLVWSLFLSCSSPPLAQCIVVSETC